MSAVGLRFALITTFYPPYHFGGDAIYVRNQAHALAQRGHTVDVIHTSDPYKALSGLEKSEPLTEPSGVRVFNLTSAFPRLSVLAIHQTGTLMFLRKKIEKIFRENTYDVIHYHNVSLIGGPDIFRYGQALKLYTAHEHWLVCPTHILWKNNREICTSRSCVSCGLAYRRPPQLWRYTRHLDQCAEQIDEFLALSEFSARSHAQFGFSREFRVFPSCVPGIEASSESKGKVATRPYFLFVGRLEGIKGLQDIIPVFQKNACIDLHIAGTGSLEKELKKLAGISPNIRFLGRVEPNRLPAMYRSAVAVVIPSKCIEVFPLVALESFREGTPILARDNGPFPDLLEQTGAGNTYKDEHELASLVANLVASPELRKAQGENALAAFQKNWTERRVYKKYFEVILEVAERKKSQSVLKKLSGCNDDGFLPATPERTESVPY